MKPNEEIERQLHRVQRRVRRRRSHYRLLFVFIMLGAFLVMLAETGRGLTYTQQARQFVQELDQKSAAEIKAGLELYARGLDDHNPTVRQASVSVFFSVTREPLGRDAEQWEQWWEQHRATWEYAPTP